MATEVGVETSPSYDFHGDLFAGRAVDFHESVIVIKVLVSAFLLVYFFPGALPHILPDRRSQLPTTYRKD
ncbi:hypothetical protein C5D47_09885 [Rathayibacter toxicus]|uniref:Uncharacterized protein n=1 Tax=Rathayibacter toxicus TaxID=145458 RepID=A0A0U1PS15_9MICO|nr:hypothetical protein VT73_07185 [Rathayibacter toxicus]PPG45884.1 hypothetical protein C5D16_09870 [Rathayibacter toxicus]PPH21825.1 hypothetical protein C5D17_09875 [Rathayibacter toxicus]PPH58351.1 hypothetical protein C5C93_09915 [Rathayibacter toxicus]PPH62462.1 hypothetical protein C5D13_09965 [Rathayibacter toxicus]